MCRVPEQCPQAVSDLVEACTQKDPAQRPDIKQAYHILKEAANAQCPDLAAETARMLPHSTAAA